ncbi:MAG: hypothetical protein IPH04_19630 [Saprospirales bacterium]|nr:hypothetical protein [Saprospirales bacterium]MBK6904954.1 hypothetical protein [Saprospirales bacterium]MBK7337630.1 hypothetical protein [Saprospirales bacterium]
MKKFFRNNGAAILWEIRFFFLRIVPVSIALGVLFLLVYAGAFLNKDELQIFFIGFLLNVGGIYLMRLVGWLVKRRISRKPEVQEDIYAAEEK